MDNIKDAKAAVDLLIVRMCTDIMGNYVYMAKQLFTSLTPRKEIYASYITDKGKEIPSPGKTGDIPDVGTRYQCQSVVNAVARCFEREQHHARH